jgi:hypothetical protein
MRPVLLFSFILCVASLAAQSSKKDILSESLLIALPPDTSKSTVTMDFVEGKIPSPEDQGFQKKSVNGKEIYFKESALIQIEYQPKAN